MSEGDRIYDDGGVTVTEKKGQLLVEANSNRISKDKVRTLRLALSKWLGDSPIIVGVTVPSVPAGRAQAICDVHGRSEARVCCDKARFTGA